MGKQRLTGASLSKILICGAVAIMVVAVGVWGVAAARKSTPSSLDSVMVLSNTGGVAGGAETVTTERRTTTTVQIWVQVIGEVRAPGVYAIPRGSRVFEAVEAAGGATAAADLDSLNLAAVVGDGSRIAVPRLGEPSGGGEPGGGSIGTGQGAQGAAVAPMSLSTADAAALDSLPGIGPATAAAIIAYREEHGPFQTVEDLEAVPGIGPATLARLRDLVVP